MKKTTVKKALALPAIEEAPRPETVKPAETPTARRGYARGHKYDNKDADLSKLTTKLVIGELSPPPPRGAGRPSVHYRLYALVSSKPGITTGELISEVQDRSAEFATHPSPYTHKERLEALWVLGYIRGMITRKFLKEA